MAVTLNASTATGLIATSDTSGDVAIQSNGTTIGTFSSVGLTMASGKKAIYTGAVLQVVSTTLTTLVTASADTWTTVTSASITPSSASNRILISYDMPVAAVGNETLSRVLRNATVITQYSGGDITQIGWSFFGGGSAGWQGGMLSGSFIDSPSTTSAITYNLQAYQQGGTLYVNRTSGTTPTDSAGGVTTITVMEIAA